MKFINSRVIYTLVFYLMAIALVVVAKPGLMFTNDGDVRLFGVGPGREESPRTVFSFGVFVLVLAIVSFYMFSVIDIVFKK
jgi:hypothetical protein